MNDSTRHCIACNNGEGHPHLTDEQFTARTHELLAEEADAEPAWWYMSFADDTGFLGGLYLKAKGAMHATLLSRDLGLNPGGEIMFLGPITDSQMEEADVPEGNRGRLLTAEEVNS